METAWRQVGPPREEKVLDGPLRKPLAGAHPGLLRALLLWMQAVINPYTQIELACPVLLSSS